MKESKKITSKKPKEKLYGSIAEYNADNYKDLLEVLSSGVHLNIYQSLYESSGEYLPRWYWEADITGLSRNWMSTEEPSVCKIEGYNSADNCLKFFIRTFKKYIKKES